MFESINAKFGSDPGNAEEPGFGEATVHVQLDKYNQIFQERVCVMPPDRVQDILKMLPTDAMFRLCLKRGIDDLVHNKVRIIRPLDVEKISDACAKALAEALKVNTTLQKLYLYGDGLGLHRNNISDEGAKALAEALKVNTALQRLDLNSNNISDEGVSSEIQSYLERNERNRLSKAISDVEHNKMEELNLCDKNISEEGGMRIRMMRKVSFCPQRPWTLPGLPCVSIRWGTMCW